MRAALVLFLATVLLAGCASGGMESRESTSEDPTNPTDDCLPGADRGAGGSDDDASQGGGRDACERPAGVDGATG